MRCASPAFSGSAIASRWLWSEDVAPRDDEELPTVFECLDIPGVVADVGVRGGAELLDGGRPAGCARVRGTCPDGRWGSPESERPRPGPAPRAPPDRPRGRRWWPAPRCRTCPAGPAAGTTARCNRSRDLVVQGVGVGRGRSFGDAEDLARVRCRTSTASGFPGTLASSCTATARPAATAPPATDPHRPPARPATPRWRAAAGSRSGPAAPADWSGRRTACPRSSNRGSTWPCGEMIGRSRTCSYNRLATARTSGSGGKSRSRMQRQWCEATRHGTHAGRLVSYEQSVAVCRRPSGPNSNTQNGNGSVTDGRQHSAGPVRIARGGRVVVLERSGRTQATPPMASIACRRACSA